MDLDPSNMLHVGDHSNAYATRTLQTFIWPKSYIIQGYSSSFMFSFNRNQNRPSTSRCGGSCPCLWSWELQEPLRRVHLWWCTGCRAKLTVFTVTDKQHLRSTRELQFRSTFLIPALEMSSFCASTVVFVCWTSLHYVWGWRRDS